MSKSSRFGGALAAVLLLASSSMLWAQTTGRIQGQVLDAQAAALPGATVTVTSPNLQGAQTQVTDSEGNYRFLSLPPGRYTVKVELASFKTFEQNNVDVGLDRTVTLPVTMQLAGVTEAVTVTGVSPTIDTTSTVTGVNAGADLFERSRCGATFTRSRGLHRRAKTPSADGLRIDRRGEPVHHRRPEHDGCRARRQGQDAQFRLHSGGRGEDGRPVRRVRPHDRRRRQRRHEERQQHLQGSVFGFDEGGVLQANDDTRDKRPATTTRSSTSTPRRRGGELGGFLVKDRLWFFGAFNRDRQPSTTTVIRDLESPGSPGINSVIPRRSSAICFAVKLTFSSAQARRSRLGDGDPPRRDGNSSRSPGRRALEGRAQDRRHRLGRQVRRRRSSSSWLLSGMVARHTENGEIPDRAGTAPQLDRSDGRRRTRSAAGLDSSRIRNSRATSSRPT